MRISKKYVGMALLALALAPVAMAAEGDITVDLKSAYVWRGQVLNDEMVVQPAFTVSTEWGLSLNAWGNMDVTDNESSFQPNTRGEFNEVDLVASYTPQLDMPVEVTIGIAEYTYPKDGNATILANLPEDHVLVAEEELESFDTDTREIYATIAGDCLLAPTLGLYYDVDEVNSLYLNLGIGHTFDLVEKLTLDLGANVGYAIAKYNDFYYGEDKTAFNDGNLTAGVNYEVLEGLSLGANVAYTAMLDSDIKDRAEEIFGKKDIFYGGVSANYVF